MAITHRSVRMWFIKAYVVTVVVTARNQTLERESEPQVYMPSAQQFNGQLTF